MQKSDKFKSAEASIEKLVGVHERALAENSKDVIEILEVLTKSSQTKKYRTELRKIKKEIKNVDKKLDGLNELNKLRNTAIILEADNEEVSEINNSLDENMTDNEGVEEYWFEF